MKRLIFIFSFLLLVVFFHCEIAVARTIYVPADYQTIQQAINAANNGDIIIVSPGTYNETINFNGKNIILRSTNPTDLITVYSTIIRGTTSKSVVTFAGTESSSCVLTGFTITGGDSDDTGGGINGNGTYATISCNVIKGNFAVDEGAGIYKCNGLIRNNIIIKNETLSGGGGLAFCNGTIEYNFISENTATWGSGLFNCIGTIQNNTISNNYSYIEGGGLSKCYGIIQANVIFNNVSNNGGGLYQCGGIIRDNLISCNSAAQIGGGLAVCVGTIQNNTISQNLAYYYGGGLAACSGIIQSNVILSNSAGTTGGGIYYCNSTTLVINNIISYNTAKNGGGLYLCEGTTAQNIISYNVANIGGGLSDCKGLIQDNIILKNYANRNGGGFYNCEGTIQNNIIRGNQAFYSGGGLFGCPATIQNNLIVSNSADTGGGLSNCNGLIQNNTICFNNGWYNGGGLAWCQNTIRNCIIWRNSSPYSSAQYAQLYNCSTPRYSCIQDWTAGGEGNITNDPRFVKPAYYNPDARDFHLKGNSPCIDAGCLVANLSSDFEGDPRPIDGSEIPAGDGSDYDIGADEFVKYLENGFFSTSTVGWLYAPFGGAASGGSVSWEPNFSGQTGVLRIAQVPGEKMNVSQLVSVKTGRWYTLEAKVATDISDINKTQKVYALIAEYSAPGRIKNTIAEAFQAGNLAYATWTTLEVSFYSTVTQVGVSIISILPQGASAGNLYVDDVMLYERAPYSAKSALALVNTAFDTAIDGWYYFAYAGASNMGTISWSTGGYLQVNQSAGNKLAGIQWITIPSGLLAGRAEIFGSLWILSSAPAVDSTQKVYVVMSSYDSGSTKIISNVQNAIQAGNLEPNTWTELKFASYPKSTVIVPTFIVILPNNRPDATLYIDECKFYIDL